MYNSAKILGRFAEEVGNALSAPPTQTPGLPSWARELESMSMAIPAGGIAFKGGMSSAKLLGKLGGKARKLFGRFMNSRSLGNSSSRFVSPPSPPAEKAELFRLLHAMQGGRNMDDATTSLLKKQARGGAGKETGPLFSSFLENNAVSKELAEQGAYGAEALSGRANKLDIPEHMWEKLGAMDMDFLEGMQLGDLTAGGVMQQFGRTTSGSTMDKRELFRLLHRMQGGRNMQEAVRSTVNTQSRGQVGRNVGPLFSSELMDLLPRY